MVTVTQQQALEAYGVIDRLSQMPVRTKTAFSLFRLRKQLKPHWEFQLEEERKIVAATGGTIQKDGRVTFEGENADQNRMTFTRRLMELRETEVKIDADPVSLDGEDITISAAEIESILPFIAEK